MQRAADVTERPPLLLRARVPLVLLTVGAVVLVSAGVAVAAAYGGPVRLPLLGLAAAAAWLSLRAAGRGLRGSAETLAACAAGLPLAAASPGPALDGDPIPALLLAGGFLVLHRLAPSTVAWPVASWAAAQLAVLRALDAAPSTLRTEVYLGVALVGLGIALVGRKVVARLALVTTAPWWLAGVVGGSWSAWTDDGGRPWLSAAVMIAAAAGLLPARLRESLDPFLGPPRLVPVVAGLVAGVAVTGASSSLGPLATTLTGYAGVLVATLAAARLEGWRRGMLLPVAVAAGSVMSALSVVRLLADHRWTQLSLLLLLTAVSTALVAGRRAEDRPVLLPTTLGCLAGAVLLALPDRLLTPVLAAVLLTVLHALAMTVGAELEPATRHGTAAAAGVCASASLLALVAEGELTLLAGLLAAQAAGTLWWAGRTGRRPDGGSVGDERSVAVAWRIGAAQLVLAAWVAAASAGLDPVEWYSLPVAVGLLIGAGPRLARGPSWPAWGPGLLAAAAPSTVLAVVAADDARAVGVFVAASVAMVAGGRTGLRAPLMIGAGTTLALALGLVARELPGPLAAGLVVGTGLLAVGVLRERRPVAGFAERLADLR